MRYITKNKCACCGKSIPTTIEHFEKCGNYCISCQAKAGRLAALRDKIGYLIKIINNHHEQQEIERQISALKKERERIIESLPQYKDIDFDKIKNATN